MKIRGLFSAILFLMLWNSFAQKNMPLIKSSEIFEKADNEYSQCNFLVAYNELLKISANDTAYSSVHFKKADVLFELKRYDDCITVCKEGLETKNELDLAYHLLILYCEEKRDSIQKALHWCNIALQQFPKNTSLLYCKAAYLEKENRTQEAIEIYKSILALNPFHSSTHLRLGNIAAGENKFVEAILCYNTCLLSYPTAGNAANIALMFNNIVSNRPDSIPHGYVLSEKGDDFSEFSGLIDRGVALNNKYKTNSALKYDFLKQSHFLFYKLQDYKGIEGFWTEFYVPFYKKMFAADLFPGFSYYICNGISSAAKTVKSHEAEYLAFNNFLVNNFLTLHIKNKMEINGVTKDYYCFYNNDGSLSVVSDSISNYDTINGNAFVFNEQGNISTKGKLLNTLNEGDWTWFDFYGNKIMKTSYIEDKINGKFRRFHANGQLKEEGFMLDDLYEGSVTTYSDLGVIQAKEYYKKGIQEDTNLYFDAVGELEVKVCYKEGKVQGKVVYYNSDGSFFEKVNFVDDNRDGLSELFYNNGMVSEKRNFKSNVLDGEISGYYENGKLGYKGFKSKGNNVGVYNTFNKNGKLENHSVFDKKGNLNGSAISYDTNGAKVDEFVYKKGILISYTTFDSKGNVLEIQKSKSKSFENIRFYDENRKLLSEGPVVRGKKNGRWTFYRNNGAVKVIVNYKNDLEDGEYLIYGSNGALAIKSSYKEGKLHGYYIGYFENGNIEFEGWYQEDKMEGDWYYYNPTGAISSHLYLIDDKSNGVQEFFGPSGKPTEFRFYDMDLLTKIEFLDTNAMQESVVEINNDSLVLYKFPNGNVRYSAEVVGRINHGKLFWYYPDGQIKIEANMVNDKKHGDWKSYFSTGQVRVEANYINDELNGVYKTYFISGVKNSEINYKNDDYDGICRWYRKDGSLRLQSVYKDGMMHGNTIRYFKDKIQIHEKWENDIMISYSFKDINGQMVEKILSEKDTNTIVAKYQDGQVSVQYTLINGLLDGDFKRFYPNGSPEIIINYEKGEMLGTAIMYYENGNIQYNESFFYGRMNDECSYYNEDGTLLAKENYFYGNLHGPTVIYDHGNKIQEIEYYNDKIIDLRKF